MSWHGWQTLRYHYAATVQSVASGTHSVPADAAKERWISDIRMINMFISEGFFCQLVSWPFAIVACSWQQWTPALAGLVSALGLRLASIGRLITFVAGATTFYLFTISQPAVWSPPADYEQSSGFVLGCLFLFPIASIISMCGLLGGDLFRFYRKRARESKAS